MRRPSPTAVPPFRARSFSGAGETPLWRSMSRLAWKPPSAITTDGALSFFTPSGLFHLDLDAAENQRQRAGAAAAQDAALALLKVRFEPLQGDVSAVVLPGEAEAYSPRRRQHVGAVAAKIDELDALVLQPLHQPAAVLCHGARQVLPREAVSCSVDLGTEDVLRRVEAGEVDVERAVGIARVAEVFVFSALLQHHGAHDPVAPRDWPSRGRQCRRR